ncbi:MAG TPA: DUF6352 family protein [Burkholderiales bacterium]|nr:DUF6352 family protein [Burkholderiales bacterium]
MIDFWRSCGFHCLKRDRDGSLAVTDDFLRGYFLRRELQPVLESCADELALHQALMRNPRLEVNEEELAKIADADARENYRVMLRFRERLLAAPSLEACYIAIFQDCNTTVPPLFIDQMMQVILRHVLGEKPEPLAVRAAEMLFRAQKISFSDGAILAADAETVETHESGAGLGNIGRFLMEAQAPLRSATFTVLNEDNAQAYWERDERHDTVLALNPADAGCAALCRVLEAWVEHIHQVQVRISPVPKIESEEWVWHVGLDAEASAILNDIYQGEEVAEERRQRLLCLFRMDFLNPSDMRAELAGQPVFLGMAMNADSLLRLKPQNLLTNLPLARRT